MIFSAIITLGLVAVSLAAPAPASAPAVYSQEWMEDAVVKFIQSPHRPASLASTARVAAAAACTAPTFTCPVYADDGVKATNARNVRPRDIQTVLAIGDSITAAFGVNSGRLPFTSITEYRGLSFDIGGDPGAITVPNFLKNYNSGLKGASTGTTALKASISVLNAAVSAAKVADLNGQVTTLTNAFKSGGYSVDGWKMINVLIGANDLCSACNGDAAQTPNGFETSFRTAMQALRNNYKNTIVNAIQIFNVSQVYFPQQSDSYCSFAQGILNECPCSKTAANRALMDSYTVQYNQRISKVAAEFNFSDFVVNVQPAVSNLVINSLNFLAKIDCFHPNQCAHQTVAGMLWNNLFQAPAQKVNNYQLATFNQLYCPGPNDYFQ
ncbi:hypothetical protein HDU97_009375 [Phlyctochytrium planicorne]|nr:hypothetical protein HDU97_009375 [Phlyctochytrium planicorne]